MATTVYEREIGGAHEIKGYDGLSFLATLPPKRSTALLSLSAHSVLAHLVTTLSVSLQNLALKYKRPRIKPLEKFE